MHFLLFVALAIVSFRALPSEAQTLKERVRRDELKFMADDHPDMAAAMRKARSSLTAFLNIARNPQSSMSDFAVKVPVKDGKKVEYFWITPFMERDNAFSGRIGNIPRSVRTVVEGQTINFNRDEIVDWMYVDHGAMKGNFTACALIKNEPKEQAQWFKRKFGLDCND